MSMTRPHHHQPWSHAELWCPECKDPRLEIVRALLERPSLPYRCPEHRGLFRTWKAWRIHCGIKHLGAYIVPLPADRDPTNSAPT